MVYGIPRLRAPILPTRRAVLLNGRNRYYKKNIVSTTAMYYFITEQYYDQTRQNRVDRNTLPNVY